MRKPTCNRPRPLMLAAAAALTLAGAAPLSGQGGSRATRPTITPDDYGKWEQLGAGNISPDGRWLAYAISRVNEENELRVRLIETDSIIVAPYGTRPTFSDDGQWLAYEIGVGVEERERLQKQKKPVRNSLGLVNLRTGALEQVDRVRQFAFSDDGGFLAMHRYRADDKQDFAGADLVIRNLATGVDINFGNVSEFAWQDEGSLIALIIDAEGQAGNGVQVFDPREGAMRVLDAHDARYRGLAWREASADLAGLRVRGDSLFEDSTHVVLAWRNLGTRRVTSSAMDPATQAQFPAGMRVVEHRTPTWSDDGRVIYFGTQERIPRIPDADTTESDDMPTVEIWHARDVDIIPEQKVRRQRLREENYLTAWHLDPGTVVVLGDEMTETTDRVEGDRLALGMDRTPYDTTRMFGPQYRDYYTIDVATGNKTPIAQRVEFGFGPSPGGKYFLYFAGDQYWTYDFARNRRTNITANVSATFTNVEDNHTVPQKPPYRIAGWTKNDESVLIYDKHDIWAVAPDGSGGRRLTSGADRNIRYRYVSLDPEEEFIDLSGPVYLSMYNEWTEEWGYARMRSGRAPETLVWGEANVGRLAKATDADVYAYVSQSYEDSPDYFVAGAALDHPRQVSHTNPFQDEYAWGRVELLDYENAWGAPLQGALFYPANYDPSRKYPMIVYIYEIVSNTARFYSVPSERSAYNTAVWNANGYFVYRPDITYRDRNPGLSAVEALEPAVARALETGMIDPDHVGLVGHSWGGYQTAFTVTQTNIFAAAVAGAPLTNLTSMYLSVYWNSGGTDARIFEISQGRMEVPFWEDVDSYLANSPVFHVDKLDTPLLLAHGTDDGAVDYNQGVEYYNAARRAGKDFVMLVYNGENHGNRKKPNQIDYHNRIMQWFGHYLKGEPAPDWITKGLSYEDQQRLLKFGKPVKRALIP